MFFTWEEKLPWFGNNLVYMILEKYPSNMIQNRSHTLTFWTHKYIRMNLHGPSHWHIIIAYTENPTCDSENTARLCFFSVKWSHLSSHLTALWQMWNVDVTRAYLEIIPLCIWWAPQDTGRNSNIRVTKKNISQNHGLISEWI